MSGIVRLFSAPGQRNMYSEQTPAGSNAPVVPWLPNMPSLPQQFGGQNTFSPQTSGSAPAPVGNTDLAQSFISGSASPAVQAQQPQQQSVQQGKPDLFKSLREFRDTGDVSALSGFGRMSPLVGLFGLFSMALQPSSPGKRERFQKAWDGMRTLGRPQAAAQNSPSPQPLNSPETKREGYI